MKYVLQILLAVLVSKFAFPQSVDANYVKKKIDTILSKTEARLYAILDDFGILPINKNLKLALLQIMEDRYAKKSLIITAQMPVSASHDYIDEPTLADAIMDRVTAKCHRIELKGDSRRKKK